MRVVSWNIRAGGGVRAGAIASQIEAWQADVIALSEFRGTDASCALATQLADSGRLIHQRRTTSDEERAKNALLIASRWPLRIVRSKHRPRDPYRWLHVNVFAPQPFQLIAVHVPNRVTGRKYPFLKATTRIARDWPADRPALIVGDTNSGRIDIDEENPAFNQVEDNWLQKMDSLGWCDGFRSLHGDRREYTWYSPNGRNGFRLDQVFVNRALSGRLSSVRHVWAGATDQRLEVLSDHASLLVDFD